MIIEFEIFTKFIAGKVLVDILNLKLYKERLQ